MGTPDTSRPGTESPIADAGPSVEESRLSPATISDLLSHRRRRYALYYLVGCDYAASVDELVEQVAVWETETCAPDVPDEVYERVHTDMYHVHLPKLAEAGAIDYDPDSDLVILADGIDRLRVQLYAAAEREARDR